MGHGSGLLTVSGQLIGRLYLNCPYYKYDFMYITLSVHA